MYRIVISQKAYSSWSLRGWLLLDAFGLPYEEVFVPLYDPAFETMKREKAPARTVPILEWEEADTTQRVWESIAIAETLADRHPDAGILPKDPHLRRIARILMAEMHSGFPTLRGDCPMNLHRFMQPLAQVSDGLKADLDRLGTLWAWALSESGGPWLAGRDFCAADVFFAPVAMRLHSYALVSDATNAYASDVLGHPSVSAWIAEARDDPARIEMYDTL